MNRTQQLYQKWEQATNKMAKDFIESHYGEGVDFYWVGDEIGDFLFVNNDFHDFGNICYAIKHGYKVEDLILYLEYRRIEGDKGNKHILNFKHYMTEKRNK